MRSYSTHSNSRSGRLAQGWLATARAALLVGVLGLVGTPSAQAQDEAAPPTPVAGTPSPSSQKPPIAAKRIPVPGTHVALVPPAGFVKAERYSGFGDEKRSASILVNELPGPYEATVSGMRDDEKLASRGMTVVSREDIKIGARTALLLRVMQEARGIEMERFILVAPVPDGTALMSATFRVSDADALRAPMEKCLRELTISKTRHPDVMRFALGKAKRLEIGHHTRVGTIYCEPGTFGKSKPGAPLVIVAPSVSKIAAGERVNFAKRRLAATAQMTNLRDSAVKELRVDGLEAVEITTTATHAGTSDAMFVLQLVLFEEDGNYWVLQAMVAANAREDWEPEFRTMIDGFRRLPVE